MSDRLILILICLLFLNERRYSVTDTGTESQCHTYQDQVISVPRTPVLALGWRLNLHPQIGTVTVTVTVTVTATDSDLCLDLCSPEISRNAHQTGQWMCDAISRNAHQTLNNGCVMIYHVMHIKH